MRCALAESTAKSKLEHGASALRDVLVALDSGDAEGIHAARVASRRLRAMITAHRGLIRKRARRRLTKDVRKITTGLGTAREMDVSIQLLEGMRMRLSGAERYACTHTLVELRAMRKREDGVIAACAAPIVGEAFQEHLSEAVYGVRAPTKCYLKEAQRILTDRRRDLWQAHAQWLNEQTDSSLHRVRIAFKKLRYACEQFGELYGKRMKHFVKALKEVQDDLGIWNDIRVTRQYVQILADGAEPMAASGIVPLSAILEVEAVKHLGAFREVADGFFAKEQRKHVKRIVARVKKPCCVNRKKD